MTPLFGLLDMPLLLVLCASALVHLNTTHRRWYSLKVLGIAAIAGASGGRALAYVWPGDHTVLIPWLVLTLHAGFAAVMGALALGKLDELLDVARAKTFDRDLLELVSIAESTDDLAQLKYVAKAALETGCIDRRHNDPPPPGGFVERRFQRIV